MEERGRGRKGRGRGGWSRDNKYKGSGGLKDRRKQEFKRGRARV